MTDKHSALEALLQAAYRYAFALCSHAEMAEDLVHESWLRVVAKHGPTPDKALLFRVVRNLFIDDIRHKTRFPSDSFDEHGTVDPRSVDPSSYASSDHVLGEGLAQLRDLEREVLFLWVFEGHTAAEIATLTGQSRGTVLSQIHRAKIKLKKHLDKNGHHSLSVVGGSKEVRS